MLWLKEPNKKLWVSVVPSVMLLDGWNFSSLGYCDSEAACAISKADGLRKVRHIDLRACFIQDQIRRRNIHVFSLWDGEPG